MKFLKLLTIACALLLLVSCGSGKSESGKNTPADNTSTVASTVESGKEETTTAKSAENVKVEINSVKMDYSSLDGQEEGRVGSPYAKVGKSYVIKVYAYGADATDEPYTSDQIEYSVKACDGTTVIDFVKVEPGEAPNEFILTPLSKGLDKRFDISASARVKSEKVWHGAPQLFSVNIVPADYEPMN